MIEGVADAPRVPQVSPPGPEGGHSQHPLRNLPGQETARERRAAPHILQRRPGEQPVGASGRRPSHQVSPVTSPRQRRMLRKRPSP